MALDIYKQTGDDLSASEFNQIVSEINSNGTAIGNKVDKASGKSLIADTEIARLATVTNQDISGKADASAVYTKTQSDGKYLSTGTSIPSIAGLASESWVLGKNYISGATYASLPDKPSIPSIAGLATVNYVDDEVESLQNQIDVLAGGEVDLSNYYTKPQSDSRFLSTGSTIDYNSLSNKPTIPSLTGYATEAWVNGKGFLTGSTFSGSYLDLTDKPSIPSIDGLANVTYVDSEIDNLQGQIDEISSGGADLTNYYTKEQANNTFIGTGATIDYNSLSNKPTIPSISGLASESWVTAKGYITGATWAGLPDKPSIPSIAGLASESWVTGKNYLTGVTWSDVSGKPSFSTVATSGSYNDLTNKPTIPSISGLATESYVDGQIDAIEAEFDARGGLFLTALESKIPLSGATSFVSNSTDTYGDKTQNIVTLSVAQYEALEVKDPNTLYFQYA